MSELRFPEQVVEGLVFPESPRWHDGSLWMTDVHAHRLMRWTPGGALESVATFDDKPSGLGFLPDGSPLVALMRSKRLVTVHPSGVSLYADLGPVHGAEPNDLVVDRLGRVYVGIKAHPVGDGAGPGSLVRVDSDRSITVVAEGLRVPNGIAITADGATLVLAETRGNRLHRYRIASDGALTPAGTIPLEATPDGLCLDAAGATWVGTVWNGKFLRVDDTGAVLDRIVLSKGRWAIACVLGGRERRTLYLLTCGQTRANLAACNSFEADLRSTANGYVEATEVGVPGAGSP